MSSRRRLLRKFAGVAGGVGLAGCLDSFRKADRSTALDLPPNPHASRLPERQHTQNEFLRTDAAGNALLPRHHTVLLLDLDTAPSVDAARTVERAMRTLEDAFDWRSDGLLHMLAWGTRYFGRLDALDDAPIRPPQVLSRTDDPELLAFDAALVLSSDTPSHLRAAENAMFRDTASVNGVSNQHRLGDVFTIRQRRTGFVGQGLPVRHTTAEGLPDNPPLTEQDRFFMGFNSGFRGTQASEQRVTIDSGTFEGGTTMHVSHLRQTLDEWFESLDEPGRVARMFSPEFSPRDVAGFTDDVPFSDAVRDHAATKGVVGHHEKVAQARRKGKPVILRRDFNTVDGGHAGVHFLALQRSLSDFERTRKAMNGWYIRDDNSQITETENNGILEFITVISRANFYVPPRANRSFPLL
ncbi:DUF7405 family protein [Haladaptatus sp. NG-SE-30]